MLINPSHNFCRLPYIFFLLQAILLIIIGLAILGVELTIAWNSLEGVGSSNLYTTGQLIPFLIGIFSVCQVLYTYSRTRFDVGQHF